MAEDHAALAPHPRAACVKEWLGDQRGIAHLAQYLDLRRAARNRHVARDQPQRDGFFRMVRIAARSDKAAHLAVFGDPHRPSTAPT